ncbi:MAG TPA: hypothetical protein VMV69_21050 [Pirellulales bacterium]|nr:hypothetical protein [Pirellulales bacterium]
MNTIERISGKITDKNGRATEGVIGTMDISPRGDDPSGSWRGELKLPLETSIAPGAFTLTLDNGRTGSIVITSVRANSGTRNAAPFMGSGPPPV